MLSCLILLRHHDNIQRLWRRQETNLDEAEAEKET
jgi:glycerol-3-phosphate acyltransferase PlsY